MPVLDMLQDGRGPVLPSEVLTPATTCLCLLISPGENKSLQEGLSLPQAAVRHPCSSHSSAWLCHLLGMAHSRCFWTHSVTTQKRMSMFPVDTAGLLMSGRFMSTAWTRPHTCPFLAPSMPTWAHRWKPSYLPKTVTQLILVRGQRHSIQLHVRHIVILWFGLVWVFGTASLYRALAILKLTL